MKNLSGSSPSNDCPSTHIHPLFDCLPGWLEQDNEPSVGNSPHPGAGLQRNKGLVSWSAAALHIVQFCEDVISLAKQSRNLWCQISQKKAHFPVDLSSCAFQTSLSLGPCLVPIQDLVVVKLAKKIQKAKTSERTCFARASGLSPCFSQVPHHLLTHKWLWLPLPCQPCRCVGHSPIHP